MLKIYKYRPFSDYSIDSYIKNDIYAVSPLILNDPYDCSFSYDENVLYEKLSLSKKFMKRMSYLVYPNANFTQDGLIKKPIQVTQAEEAEKKRIICAHIKKEVALVIESIRKRIGIISFTSSPNNLIMWSHYSNNSEGFLLSYNKSSFISSYSSLNTEIFSNFGEYCASIFCLHKVVYSNNFPIANEFLVRQLLKSNNYGILDNFDNISRFFEKKDDVNFLINLLTTKKEEWSYEQEYRYIVPLPSSVSFDFSSILTGTSPMYFFPVFKLSPSEIFIGRNTKKHNAIFLALIAEKKKIPYYFQTAPFNNNGRIIFKKIPLDNLMNLK